MADPEDREVLRYAALAYARFSFYLTRARGYYMVSPMLIVTDDREILEAENGLEEDLARALDALRAAGYTVKEPVPEKLVHAVDYNSFKELVTRVTRTL